MRIFVTGGSGFLGSELIARLIKEGHHVYALSRNSQSAQKFKMNGVLPVEGDFNDISRWENSLNEIDAVIHCAAPVEFWGKWENFENDIVKVTKNLLLASDRQKAKRFIYISSESVLQDKEPLLDITEEHPYPEEPSSYYGKAKMLAEKEILNYGGSVHCIIIRPTFIWGKGVKALDTMIDKIKAGQFMWIDSGDCPIETVHVKNVVESIILSLSSGNNKSIYNVTDDSPASAREFLSALIETKGVKVPERNMPGIIASAAAVILESFWKLFGIQSVPPLSRFELSFVHMPRRYNIVKIKNELGYRPVVSVKEGLREMKG